MVDLFKAIVFDLGGVLVELDGPPIKSEWLNGSLTAEESWDRWCRSPFVRGYEKGQISSDEFARGILQEQELTVLAEEFIERYTQWPVGLFPGVLDLLAELKKHYVVALYSNTSDLHWPRLMEEMQLDGKFDHYFASFQMGMYKPEVSSFTYVAKEMQLKPADILFLDDNALNVNAAREAGMSSEWVKGIDEVKAVLKKYHMVNL